MDITLLQGCRATVDSPNTGETRGGREWIRASSGQVTR